MLKKYKHLNQVSKSEMKNLLGGVKQSAAKCIPDGQYCDCTIPCCRAGNACGIIPHLCGSGGGGDI